MPCDLSILATLPPEADARRYVQSLLEWKRRDPGIPWAGATPRPIRSVAIVGAGMMGTAIAAVHVRHGLTVVIADADGPSLATAAQRIAAELELHEGLQETPRQMVARLVEPTTDDGLIAQCDLVLESIVETPVAKQQLYGRLEPRLPTNTILASNTSTIPIARLAAGLGEPRRFCGLHFFHPVRLRPLVEIVRGPLTGDDTVAAAVGLGKSIGKIPIVVADGPGFLVNRLLVPYLNEALDLLLDGATIDALEQAATGFGMAMGPIRLMDEIGLDVALAGGVVLRDAFPERIPASPVLIGLIKAGRLGCKTRAGFYSYSEASGPAGPDPAVQAIIARWARPRREFTPEAILARLLLPMVLEATRILEERRIHDPRDIDLGVLFGLGFPQSRGGLLYWADSIGVERILEALSTLESLGERARPTRLLEAMAQSDCRFAGPELRRIL